MMKIFKIFALIVIVVYSFVACQETNLEDFDLQAGQGVQVAASTNIGTIAKTNETLTIPVNLKLSGGASKAFEVSLRINQDTVTKQIQEGKLTNVTAIASSSILIDNVAKVNYGSDVAQFEITVARTEVEKHFGKKIAIGYTIDNVGKENSVDQTQNTGIIVINTSELLTVDDIHYISLQTGGNIIEVKDRQNYSASSGGISIPLVVNLASFPSSAFSVAVAIDTDTVDALILAGTLPANTVALQEGEFTVVEKVTFPSNASEATFALDVPWTVINNNLGKQLAIVVRLESPTLHILNPEKSYTTILIDCDNVLEEDVTHLGVFSVNRDNNGGPDANEGSKKMVDNNFNNKFLQANFTGDLVCTLVFPEPQKIGAYTLTSANDAASRDPKEWNLQGSNDGINWTTIDSRSNQVFATRLLTRRFNVAYPVSYTHYRLNITAIVGGTNLFQICEWRMIKVR
ncbi:discoidin domain-containing protein [Sphingobacterium olei]|uniref:Discoidin domain-containing protein n=1 Tax=Sphingobacterium olei TaxID=2571155 RepID=A0A4U0P3C9_9SPHI|nr:discoidin domain-containing protein [Sphingobacterium olei]TJZ61837.1 discoidin domain-containing protein [Sphingobacterium olei]